MGTLILRVDIYYEGRLPSVLGLSSQVELTVEHILLHCICVVFEFNVIFVFLL